MKKISFILGVMMGMQVWAQAAEASYWKKQKFDVNMKLKSAVTVPNADDPCIAYIHEYGYAEHTDANSQSAKILNGLYWDSRSVDSFCNRGNGVGDHYALSVFTDKDNDKIYVNYRTIDTLSKDNILSWPGGDFEIVYGTGKYKGIKGKGEVHASFVDLNTSNPDGTRNLECGFKGYYILPKK